MADLMACSRVVSMAVELVDWMDSCWVELRDEMKAGWKVESLVECWE